MHRNMRHRTGKIILLAVLVSVGGVGFAFQGWGGALFWPLGLCASVLLLGITWFVIDLAITFSRHRAEVRRIWDRVRPLSTERLRELIGNPSHKDSGFARVELMRRGVDVRPPKEQLFGMLTSGDTAMCGQAMAYLHMFYPEMNGLIPTGSSNQDPPELWQSRIAALRSAS
jgi:hypothetical protein